VVNSSKNSCLSACHKVPLSFLGEGDLGGEVKKQKAAKMVNIYQISPPTPKGLNGNNKDWTPDATTL